MRKAGCTLLGIIVEGCSDAIRQMLPTIIPYIINCASENNNPAGGSDSNILKETALFVLGQFSEYCQPEILYYHEIILPLLYNSLDINNKNIQVTTCYVLELFCENLQKETTLSWKDIYDSLSFKLKPSSYHDDAVYCNSTFFVKYKNFHHDWKT